MKKQLSFSLRLLLLSGVVAIMSVSCIFIPPKEENEKLVKDGLTCVWQDEFDYTGFPDTNKWTYQTGTNNGWGNNELQNYIDNTSRADTAIVGDGYLKIKAYLDGSEWKSARLNSRADWKYGYIEARMKITDRKGAWPAFWMMPTSSAYGDWPNSGEIDIMENAPAVADHKLFSSLHAAGHYGEHPVSIGGKVYDDNLRNEWHKVGVKWTETEITTYYDDVAVGSYTNDGTRANWPYDQKFHIILNLAIGGNLGGTSYVNSLGGQAEFLVDYVRVYQ